MGNSLCVGDPRLSWRYTHRLCFVTNNNEIYLCSNFITVLLPVNYFSSHVMKCSNDSNFRMNRSSSWIFDTCGFHLNKLCGVSPESLSTDYAVLVCIPIKVVNRSY